ncbi:MAG: DUF1836 domain-containing protein [Clostridia bacterium]|nr:DUF1836 domain-containing protein [Clostridia bacterium]
MIDTEELRSFRCPGWASLPEIELYMDQVLTLVGKYFGIFSGADNVTASMINNYVKAGVVPAPKKKRYGKEHICRIFMICVLKRVLSISQIGRLLSLLEEKMDSEHVYGLFCTELDRSVGYIGTILSGGAAVNPACGDKAGAELSLQCAVDAVANCILADVILQQKPDKEETAEKQ